MEINSKPTSYNNRMFRSRLEAKWAYFWDETGIKYDYEPRYFDTPLGGYLPDFYMPSDNVWIEVKPSSPSKNEITKLAALNEQVDGRCFFMCSFPTFRHGQMISGAWIISLDGARASFISIIEEFKDPEKMQYLSALKKASRAFSIRSIGQILEETVFKIIKPVNTRRQEMWGQQIEKTPNGQNR